MGAQDGGNSGVSGIIALKSSGFPNIQAQIFGFALALLADPHKTTGPGDQFSHTYYSSNVGGSGTATGRVQSAQSPFPASMHNLQGSLIHQVDTGCSITMPVLIRELSCKKDKKTEDLWDIEIIWLKNGVAVPSWKGSAVTYSQPALATKEINEGTQRAVDPNALGDSATTRTFLPTPASGTNSTYSQVSTLAAIAAYNAAATPPATGLKVVNSAFVRVDDAAGFLFTQWGLLDTKDQVEFPRTLVVSDDNQLADRQTIASVFTAASPPSDPATPSGLQLRTRQTDKLTPLKSVRVWDYARRNTADDMVFPQTHEWRSALSPARHVEAFPIIAISTLEAQADSIWSVFQSATNILGVALYPVTPTQRMVVYHYEDPGVGLTSELGAASDYQIGRNNGGTAEVFVVQALDRGSSFKLLRLGRSYKNRVARRLIITRLIMGTSAPDHQALVGNTNNASFLGLPAGSVLYKGDALRTNIGLSGTYPFSNAYEFLWIEGGHYLIDGWAPTRYTTAAISAGWNAVSSLTNSGMTASVPAQSDFSVFL